MRGIQEVQPQALGDSGVLAAPFLGQVASDTDGMLQLVELEQLLPASLRALLFPSSATAPATAPATASATAPAAVGVDQDAVP